jgi:hypothetical protein
VAYKICEAPGACLWGKFKRIFQNIVGQVFLCSHLQIAERSILSWVSWHFYALHTWATEPMARVPKMARGIFYCPNCFYFSCPTSVEYVYRYSYLTAWRLYLNYRCYQITLRTQIGSGAKCWLDISDWGTDLAVTGRIRDIGQNALLCSFRIGSGGTSSYLQIYFLVVFLEEASIKNMIIVLCVHYTI